MAIFTRSIIVPHETATVNTIDTKDLPVNPISFLLLIFKFLNDTAYTKATLANVLATLDRVTVRFRGNSIISLSGEDLYAYVWALWARQMHQVNAIDLDNAVRSMVLPIPFGRRPFDPNMAFPATSRGNLVLELDWASAFTNLDGLTYSVEAVELPEATPPAFLRATTLSHTPAATGDQDIQLPIGNPLLMLLLFGTTIPTGATATKTINSAQLLVDNAQRYYTKSEFEALKAAFGLVAPPPIFYDDHVHASDMAAAYTQYQDTNPAERGDDINANYCLMDFDPLHDGHYILDTAGLSDLKLRIDAGDTNAIRVIPVELFTP